MATPLSEEQARTKWCPFAKVAGFPGSQFEGVSFNRGNDYPTGNGGAAGCIASDCMAWRDGGEEPGERTAAENEFRRTGRRLNVTRVGFCGLAGRSA